MLELPEASMLDKVGNIEIQQPPQPHCPSFLLTKLQPQLKLYCNSVTVESFT